MGTDMTMRNARAALSGDADAIADPWSHRASDADHISDRLHHGGPRSRMVPTWPLLVLALPAAVAVWSGWVGIGQMTGFGIVHPLPGIWDSLQIDTAVTLPVGVEAYAAMALHAWLTSSRTVSARTRRFARWSAIGALALGVVGQVAYHLLAEAHVTRAPWQVTTLVASLPVVVLGLGTALAHMLHADTAADGLGPCLPDLAAHAGPADEDHADHVGETGEPSREEPRHGDEAGVAIDALVAAGQRVSRRGLRAAGFRGSNAELGDLARRLRRERTDAVTSARQW